MDHHPPISHTTNTSSGQNFHLGYRPSLDGLRGIAILAVMIFHTNWPYTGGGRFGVDVFFVMSGFLITSLLLEEWDRTKSISLKKFYMRRVLRLLPALLLMLAVFGVYAVFFAPDQKTATRVWKSILCTVFYMSNWVLALDLKPYKFSALSHAWSLSIEEQFYMLWPLLLKSMLRLKFQRNSIIYLTLGGLLASAVLRTTLWHYGVSEARVFNGLDTRADALLAGCVTGLLVTWGVLPKLRVLTHTGTTLTAIAVLILICLGVGLGINYMSDGIFTGVAVATALVLAALVTSPPPYLTAILESRGLVWIGRISYGLYLWHFPIPAFFALYFPHTQPYLGLSPIPRVLFFYGLTFLIATASFYWLEVPILRLKKRFTPLPKTCP